MPTPTTPVRIAMLDDHVLFQQSMRYLLQALPYVEVVEEAREVTELLAICRRRLPDVVLLDLQMPTMAGPEVAELLLSEFADVKIIVLSMFSADKFITQMMKLGARSYVPKDADQAQLIQAIEEVITTGAHITPRMSRALLREVQQPTRNTVKFSEIVQLTAREEDVLQLTCEGCTAHEIADRLCISRRTVEGHRQKLLEKTGAPNVAGLVIFALKNGIINL